MGYIKNEIQEALEQLKINARILTPEATFFQSYNSIIVKTTFEEGKRKVYLDNNTWDYSKTTSKYRNQFLGESTKETQKKIKSGEYTLINLN